MTSIRFFITHIIHDWLRSLLTIISVAAIVCVYLLNGGLIKDIDQLGKLTLSFPESLLLVTSINSVFPSDSHITLGDMDFYSSIINKQFGDNTVTKMIPMIHRQIYLDGNVIMVSGATYEDLAQIAKLKLVMGSWPQNNSEVLVNLEFSSITGKEIGDSILVYGNDLTISGLTDSPLWRNATVVLSYSQAVDIYASSGEFQIGVIQIASNANPIKIHDFLKTTYKSDNCCNLFLYDHYNVLAQNGFKSFQSLTGIFQVLMLLLITFGAYNAAAMVIAEHNREIILLRIIGFSGMQVKLILFIRTYLVMLGAFLFGWFSALIISTLKTRFEVLTISGTRILMNFSWSYVFAGLGLITLCTIVGVQFSIFNGDPLKHNQGLRAATQGRVI
ncbi:MAG: hypothetical protein MUO40_12065 [Anaerolineaceae bacterium]|nr:hypothetical protein [Anaerolineaceae bacterium]